MAKKLLIGIDPGVKTGVAIWSPSDMSFVDIFTSSLIVAYEQLKTYATSHEMYLRIEDPNKRKWYGKNAHAKQQGAGSVKRDAKAWKEICEENLWHYEMIHPIKGATKINELTFRHMTGFTKRTSEHARDAAMLVINISSSRMLRMQWQ